MTTFDESRAFGVEIELRDWREQGEANVPLDIYDVAVWLQLAGIEARAEPYNHTTRSYWKVTTDSSCGLEIVSPLLYGQEGLNAVANVMAVLTLRGAVVDESCGFHVHHDAREMTKCARHAAVVIYAKYQHAFAGLLSQSRRSNRYARPVHIEDLSPSTLEEFDQDRYRAINLDAFRIHGSIEFRQHEGTLNAKKALAWIVTTQLIVGYADAHPNFLRKGLKANNQAEAVAKLGQMLLNAYGVNRSTAFEREAFRALVEEARALREEEGYRA